MNREDTAAVVRRLRGRYDALPPGGKATLRRCATASELGAEGMFWRLVDDAHVPDDERWRMAHVVACFDAAGVGRERFARWLRGTAYGDVQKPDDLPARAVRVRRMLASRDRDELVHHLRRLLRHGFQKSRRGVDWGALGADILFWGDGVRRSWAEEFFTSKLISEPSLQKESAHV